MLETSARLLRLLSLLQSHRDWTGPDLAERLGVSTRTVRTDIERLRSLGYPVHAQPGVAGGYRLGAGAALPPLLLDDEEAVAVAVGLRTAAGGSIAGIEETSVRALLKLEQVLPSRLRHRVDAVHAATTTVPGTGPTVDPDVLTATAAAIRANERLRFDYVNHDGTTSIRTTEPHRLVSWGRRWYLVAWDNDRQDWRTFRVDRMSPRTPTGPRFTPRELPEKDVSEFVQRGVGSAVWRYRARVLVHASAEQVAAKLPLAVQVEPVDGSSCIVEVGSDTPHQLALYLGLLDVDFEVLDAPELAAAFERLGDRYHRAARRP
ncbi:MAG TPA: WYL domain-containing protein [Kribbella sp.]|nr:WYL domain-containing protein [Kribbella sp.]